MITNARQYRITKAQLQKLSEALRLFDLREVAKEAGSLPLAKAEHEALISQVEELAEQVAEYEALTSGAVGLLKAGSLEELPKILIKARIAKGLSQRGLAAALGLKEQQIQRYEAGNYASASLRRLAEVARALNLEVSQIAELHTGSRRPRVAEQEQGLDWNRFPIQEMHRRRWFADFFTGSLTDLRKNSEDVIGEFVRRILPNRVPALLRAHLRTGSTMDQYALLAWKCRVLSVAKQHHLGRTFTEPTSDHNWLRELVSISCHPDGPRRAKDYLEAAGVHVVIEPHLQHTYLDGAALRLPNHEPVVALTLRYDRLDNFWFVLVHEVVHVIRHLGRSGVGDFFDDLDAEPDELEKETDELVAEALLPASVWDTALARYVRTKESVEELAEQLQISPAIIAGRIRREAEDYTLFPDLVGQGAVRARFPEVNFGQ